MLANNWGDKFGHRPMKDLARFLTTYNMASQTIAVDENVYDIQSTGTGACTINGIYIPSLTVDAAYPIATAQAAPTVTTESWQLLCDAGVTTFAVDDEVYTGTLTGVSQKFYKCLAAHKCIDGTQPAQNPQLWQAIPNAHTLALAINEVFMAMVTAESDGTLGVWIACSVLGTGEAQPALVVPYFDPAVYCVVAFMGINNTTNAAENSYGAVGTGAGYITHATDATFYQVIGPVFPHPDNMPKN